MNLDPNLPSTRLRDAVRALMAEQQITVRDLARRMRAPRSSVAAFLHDPRGAGPDDAMNLARALGVSYADLILPLFSDRRPQ